MKRLSNLLVAGAVGLVVAAIGQQMQRPPDKRTWTGHVLGVPYDFRPPTLQRFEERWWNPKDPHILTPHMFGVGWGFNLYQVVHKLESLVS